MPRIYNPPEQAVYFAIQKTAGVPADGTTGTTLGAVIKELCKSITPTETRQTEDQNEYAGAAATFTDSELISESGSAAISTSFRPWGIGGHALANIAGIGADAGTYTSPPATHVLTPNPYYNDAPLMTIWWVTANDATPTNFIRCLYDCKVSDVHLAAASTGTLACDVTINGAKWFKNIPLPTSGIKRVGVDTGYPKTRIKATKGAFTIQGSAGAYTAHVLGADITIARTVTPEMAIDTAQAFDHSMSELEFTGTLNYQYDGMADGSVMGDYLNYATLGDGVTNLNSLKWSTDDLAYSVEIKSGPWKFNSNPPDYSGNMIRQAAAFRAENDVSLLNAAVPIVTAVKSVTLINTITTLMTT